MIRFSICGAASYACGELLRLMVNHPETQVAHLADSFAAGRRIQDEHPALMGFYDQEILPLNDETIAQIVEDSDVVFTAVDAGTVCGIAERSSSTLARISASVTRRCGRSGTIWITPTMR